MVTKLANVAVNTTVEVIFLKGEIHRLQEQASKISDTNKVKNRKVPSEASVEEVVRWRRLHEQKEKAAAQRRNRTIRQALLRQVMHHKWIPKCILSTNY